MPGALRIVLAAIMALALPALGAEPHRILDVDSFCEDVLQKLSNEARQEAADLVADSIGKPESSGALTNAMRIFDGKNFDFTKKVVDKNYNGALRQIVYYSYIQTLGFVYFRFNFKMSSTGWILANFTFKDETMDLFPKDFVDR
jgi:hypothetical protein